MKKHIMEILRIERVYPDKQFSMRIVFLDGKKINIKIDPEAVVYEPGDIVRLVEQKENKEFEIKDILLVSKVETKNKIVFNMKEVEKNSGSVVCLIWRDEK